MPPRDERRAFVRGFERTGQRHVKTELVEHVWIAPFDEQIALATGQRRSETARQIRSGRLGAQTVERTQSARGQLAHAGFADGLSRPQRDKIAKRGGFRRQDKALLLL